MMSGERTSEYKNSSILQSASSNRIAVQTIIPGQEKNPYQKQWQQKRPHQSSNWQDQSLGQPLPVSSSASINNGIFTSQFNSQPITGRSPLVANKLGKLIMGVRMGPHQVRQSLIRHQSPKMAYEVSHLVEDFELMKNVQNLIEENAFRCSESTNLTKQDSLKMDQSLSLKEPNLFLPKKESKEGLFQNTPYQESLQPRLKSQNNRQSQSSRMRNEAADAIAQNHYRNSSACPQNGGRQEKKLLVQEYLNQNLFSQMQSDQDRERYMETLSKMLRLSHQNQASPLFPMVKKVKETTTTDNEMLIQDKLNTNQVEAYDSSALGYSNESTLQRGKPVKNIQKHNQLNFQKKNPAALYVQMTKQKEKAAAQLSGRFGDLQLVGNQFSSKIFPTEASNQFNFENRRGSNDLLTSDPKEMLLLLKRRQLDFSYRDRANKIGTKNLDADNDSLLQDQSLIKAELTATDATMKEIRDSIRLDNHATDSRQPQVGMQKSEKIFQINNNRGRRFITAGAQSNKNLNKKPTSNQTSKEQTSLMNQLKTQNTIQNSRAKLKSFIPERTESMTVGAGTTQDQSTGDTDPSKKTPCRTIRPPAKKLYMLPVIGNGNMQIETEEEKMERILRLQKQIKAKYNDISQKLKTKDEPYKFVIIKGNNSELIKRCLEERNGDWVEISSTNTLFNFKWVPFSKGVRFDYLSVHGVKKMVNHFEFHDQITEKHNLFHNMQKFYESQKKNVFENLPITFTLDCGSASYFIELERFQIYFQMLDKHKSDIDRQTNFNKEVSSHHLFPASKKSHSRYTLCENMFDGHNLWLLKPTDFNRGRGVQVFNTFDQFKKLIHEYQQGVEVKFSNPQTQSCQVQSKSPDIRKAIMSNCQSQINSSQDQVLTNFSNLEAIPNIVKTNNFVIQKYLERPLLLKKRKFDIRLWVLVTQEGKCYQFKEGYIRTSSVEYDTSPESLDKAFIHLTNNAVQRYNDSYGAFEEGNQLSFKQGSVLLRSEGTDLELSEMVEGSIQDIIKETLKSVDSKLNQQNRKFCFEIFGYDFIIDASLKPWLIEVNTNPCLEESSSLLRVLIPRMIDDALKLTLDVVFPPKKKAKDCLSPTEQHDQSMSIVICSEPGLGSGQDQNNVQKIGESYISINQSYQTLKDSKKDPQMQIQASKFSVPGYSDTENLWNLIYQLKV